MIELKLPPLTCGHCVKTVTQTVQRIDAAARVTIDLASHKLQIESPQPATAFAAALAEEGYAPA